MENEIPVTPAPTPTPPTAPEIQPVPVAEVKAIDSVKKTSRIPPGVLIVVAIVIFAAAGAILYMVMAPKPKPPTPLVTLPAATTPAPRELSLSLTSPTTNTVSTGKMLTVSGVTLPNTSVVMYTEATDSAVQSNDAGIFEGNIELSGGVNTLTVTAMDADGNEKSVTEQVVFDDQVLGVNTEASHSAVGRLGRFIQKDVAAIEKEYQVDKNTRYVDYKNKPLKINTRLEKEIGLAVVEDGEATHPGLLKKALKIFVTPATGSAQFKESKRRAVQGVVISNDGSVITLAHQIQRDRQTKITVDAHTKIVIFGVANPIVTQIMVGFRIVTVGNISADGSILATRIFVIPGRAAGIDREHITPFPTTISTPSATPTLSI